MELTGFRRVVLDTTACIYFLQGSASDRRHLLVEPVVRAGEAGDTELLLSTITVTELLTAPMRAGDRQAQARAHLFSYEICRPVPVDVTTAEKAARIRARYGLRTPDAVICATGLTSQADAVIGNDARWKRVEEISYLHLDEL
ncbi:MAG: type II toxin-antitoxin system VapC family toxin [Actinomycetota bacterium]